MRSVNALVLITLAGCATGLVERPTTADPSHPGGDEAPAPQLIALEADPTLTLPQPVVERYTPAAPAPSTSGGHGGTGAADTPHGAHHGTHGTPSTPATPQAPAAAPDAKDGAGAHTGGHGSHGDDRARPARSAPKPTPSPKPQTAAYTCPMHPEVRSEKPGRCPKCGMKLAPAATDGAAK